MEHFLNLMRIWFVNLGCVAKFHLESSNEQSEDHTIANINQCARRFNQFLLRERVTFSAVSSLSIRLTEAKRHTVNLKTKSSIQTSILTNTKLA